MEFTPHKYGNYLLLQRLASGGMSEVYRGIASGAGKFHKQVAIKRILPAFSSDEGFEEMFEYEAHLASRLSHSNIVEIYDFVKLDDTYLLAMEFVEGKNGRQLLNKMRAAAATPRIEVGLYIVNEVCKGLEYAHTRRDALSGDPWKIVHRDISPENIMISYEGDVKIVDFGIARAKDRVQVTQPDIVKGKLGYLSPESASGSKVDHRTDIFSAGLVLYELITGERVFPTENLDEALRHIEHCLIPLPSTIRPDISPELEILVMKALAKEPAERYESAGAFQRELQVYLRAYYPQFLQKDLADFLSQLFERERQDGRQRWEAACREAAALTLAELESSLHMPPRAVNPTAGISASSTTPPSTKGPATSLPDSATREMPAVDEEDESESRSSSFNIPRAEDREPSFRPAEPSAEYKLAVAQAPKVSGESSMKIPLAPREEFTDDESTRLVYLRSLEQEQKKELGHAEKPESSLNLSAAEAPVESSFNTPPLDRTTSFNQAPSDASASFRASPSESSATFRPAETDRSQSLSAGDRSEPSLNLMPGAIAARGRHELPPEPPKSATATSAAIERGQDVAAPPPPPRTLAQDFGRHLAIGAMVGLVGLFAVHRWSRIHHLPPEPEKAPEYVNEPSTDSLPIPPPAPQEQVPQAPVAVAPPPQVIPVTPPRASVSPPLTPPSAAAPSRRHPATRRGAGRVEIRTNRTATLYIDDKLYGKVRANHPVTLSLSSDRWHTLHFLSAANGVDAVRHVSAVPKRLIKKAFNFQSLARRKTNRRPARIRP